MKIIPSDENPMIINKIKSFIFKTNFQKYYKDAKTSLVNDLDTDFRYEVLGSSNWKC